MEQFRVIWTDYMKYRANLRGLDLADIEQIVRYSNERYLDAQTGRFVAVGRAERGLLMVAFESEEGAVIPVTAHITSRSQIVARIKSGRFRNE